MALQVYGPHLVWQEECYSYWCVYICPLSRLELAGPYGLKVGRGSRILGGLQTHLANRFKDHGLAYLRYDSKGRVIHAFACQLAFPFLTHPLNDTW